MRTDCWRPMLEAALVALLTAATAHADGREAVNINAGWKFSLVDEGQPGTWRDVDLPHTWNAEDTLDGDREYRMGEGLYRKEIALEPRADRRYFLRFEGANIKSRVQVNGKDAGSHRGGYTAFAYEITDLIVPGTNVIEVLVDNSFDREIMPLYCDYNFYGGIYRDVHLIATAKDCITVTDHASPGVYLTQKSVSAERADLEFRARVSAHEAAGLAARFTVVDAAGAEVKTVEAAAAPAGEWLEARAALTLDSPHLWNGTGDPYLYKVRTELLKDGEVIDEVVQPLGLRYFSVDNEKGFFLNGSAYDLHGVNRHQDREGKGNALSAADHEEDFALMREMGVNAARLAHYPQADLAYSICDREGIVVWAELPFIGRTGDRTGVFLDSESFQDNLKLQLVELIRQNYNHPAIVFWGLFNELAPPGDPVPLLRELNELAHQEDPARLTVVAAMLEGELNDVTDLTCWNQYWGWYYGTAGNFDNWADGQHGKHPDRKLCMSEYGAGASVRQHSEWNYNVITTGPWHPENYQAHVHEKLWPMMAEREYFFGTFLWNMFDFGVVKRDEGDRANQNDKGMVTFDRKTKKDVFYFYKANWNPEPMIYITNKRFVGRRFPRIEVKVYCNAGPAELTVNGKRVAMESQGYNIYTAKVWLKPGANAVSATAAVDGRELRDECSWNFLTPGD